MRIVIATVQVPFVRGGAEMLADGLQAALESAGHEAQTVRLPFKWYPPERLVDQILASRLLDLSEASGVRIDRVIGLRFPAYLVPHPDKVLWLLHQHRAAYDLWDGPLCDLRHFPNGREVRDAIRSADEAFLPESRRVYTISKNVASRLQRFSGLHGDALYHPPPESELFRSAPAEDFLYLPSRINRTKRQLLVVEALSLCEEPVRVRFAGRAEDPGYEREIADRVGELRLSARIEWLGEVAGEAKRELYARCLGVVFPPLDEDYGYITLEAMLARKPVITCMDSGGPLEFVRDGETGMVLEPSPQALARAMDRFWRDRREAARWGQAGRDLYDDLDINWPHVVDALTRDA
jgi:glycosyltransferase involved in cell wall biosynthesis